MKFIRPQKLLFFGAPGAGKGTYASRLGAEWGVPHISTGDIIRGEIKNGTVMGKKFQSYSDQGALVPDELMIEMTRKRLNETDCQSGWILDGFPRTLFQAEQLAMFTKPSLCVNFFLPYKYLIMKLSGRRVCAHCGANYNVADIRDGEYDMPPLLPKEDQCDKCGKPPDLIQRDDDTEEVVKKRLQTYKVESEPVLDFYKKDGILLEFAVKKGVKDLPQIRSQIMDILQLP